MAYSDALRNGNALMWVSDRQKVDNNHLWPDQTYCALPPPRFCPNDGQGRNTRATPYSASSSSSLSFYHPTTPPLPHHHHRPHPPHHHGDNGKRVPTASGRYVQTMIWLNLTGAVLNTNLAVLTELCFDNNTPSVLYNIHCSDSVHLCTAQNWNRLQPNFTLLAC